MLHPGGGGNAKPSRYKGPFRGLEISGLRTCFGFGKFVITFEGSMILVRTFCGV